MKVKFTAKKMELSDEFKDKVMDRLERLEKFFDNEADATVVLSNFKNLIKAEVTVRYKSFIYRCEKEDSDKFIAVDAAADVIERRIVKNKDKLITKLRSGAFDNSPPVVAEEEPADLVRVKEFDLHPMHQDEAIMQLELIGHNFFVFLDVETNGISVVYKRNDGGYGILRPQY